MTKPDIVERLNNSTADTGIADEFLLSDAADEIERLRGILSHLRDADVMQATRDHNRDVGTTLRAWWNDPDDVSDG
jgi:hypothetical protein